MLHVGTCVGYIRCQCIWGFGQSRAEWHNTIHTACTGAGWLGPIDRAMRGAGHRDGMGDWDGWVDAWMPGCWLAGEGCWMPGILIHTLLCSAICQTPPEKACKANVYRVTSQTRDLPHLALGILVPVAFSPVLQNRMTKHRIRDTHIWRVWASECADKNRTLDPTRLVAGLPCVDSADWPVRDDDGCSPLERLQRWRMGLARPGRRDGLYSALGLCSTYSTLPLELGVGFGLFY